MAKKNNKARIGGFILGGIAFLIISIITLGGRNIFSDSAEYVLYFDGSVSGLSLGAPVVFRGVPLGKVTQIVLVANTKDEEITIPVYITIEPNSIALDKDSMDEAPESARIQLMQRMIQRGLRARLHMRSLVTGQYSVELDFFPETPARYHSSDHSREIPTVASSFDEFQRTLSRLPLEEMSRSLRTALEAFSKLASNEDLAFAIKAFRKTFENTSKFTANADSLRGDLQRAINALSDTSTALENQLPEAMATLQLALTSFAALAKDLQVTVDSANKIISPNSKSLQNLNSTLSEISKAAKAIRELSKMLEKNPQSLILGKGAR